VTGVLTDDLAGAPIEKAMVAARGENLEAPVLAHTDAGGRFTLTVPAGVYALEAEKSGFFPLRARALDLRPEDTPSLELELVRKRVISGRLVFPDGDPLEGAMVGALSLSSKSFERPVRSLDNGEFRVTGLLPGRYKLQIVSLRGPRPAMTRIFPSLESNGAVLDVGNVGELSAGDIILQDRAAGTSVEGEVLAPKSLPPDTFFDLRLTLSLESAGGVDSVRVKTGEPFRFPSVPPGHYYLFGFYPSTGAANPFGIQEVSVGTLPVQGLRLTLPDPLPMLRGTVELESDGVRRPATGLRFSTVSTAVPLSSGPSIGDAEGVFKIELSSGERGGTETYLLRITSLPEDAYIANVTQGERTFGREPLVVSPSGDKVRILLKTDGGSVSGHVASPQPLKHPAFVVLAPLERDASQFYRTGWTDRRGNYELAAIAPGSYELFVFDKEADYEGAESLRSVGVKVEVQPKAVLQKELTLRLE
jgi:hypothetical protein